MKDLVDVLDDIKNRSVEMEFCEDFNKLQLILNNVNQFVRSFDKIVFDSGNEPYIIEVVARLLKYLRIQNYLDKENKVNKQYEVQLRKIMMYMLLNTDVSFRYDLSQDSRVSHLLNSLPQMSKCLVLNCIWGLDLDRFLYEMISYAPLWFSMQFLDQAIVSLKYGKPYEVLERVESMVRAIYFAICRTDCDWRKIDRNRYVDQQRTLGRMFDFIADMLRYFNTPDAAKFAGWSKLRKHRYFGFVLKHMLNMTSGCLELYFRKPAIGVKPELSVYEMVNDRHVPREAGTDYSQPSDNVLSKINNCLLNTLETCILHVSLDRFLYWAEIDLFKEGEDPVTLQQVIGESAYRLSEELRVNKQVNHTIVRHLAQFAMRPKSLAERATTMFLGMLILRIDSANSVDERCVYLNEFVSRKDRVFGNAECLETVEQYWQLLDGSHVRLMIEYDTRQSTEQEQMEEDDVPDEQLKLRALILKTVDTLPAKDFHHLLTFTLDTYGKTFSRYQEPDMGERLIELINRTRDSTSASVHSDGNSPTAGVPSVQQLLFQSPATFYSKLVHSLYDACAANEQYVDAIVAIIVGHKSIAQRFMREHLELLLTGNFEFLRSPLLSQLVCKLYKVELFEPQEFIEKFYLQGLRESFTKPNFAATYGLLKLADAVWLPFISTIAKGKEAITVQRKLVPKFVLCLFDLICGLRGNIWQEPLDDADQTVVITMALELLEKNLKLLQKLATNEDKKNLLETVSKAPLLSTQYYFRKYIYYTSSDGSTTTPSDTVPGEEDRGTAEQGIARKASTPLCQTFAEFMYQDELNPSSDPEKIRVFLRREFPQCTRPEAIALSQDDLLCNHIQPVVASIIGDLLSAKTSHQGWLRSCISNYIHTLLQVVLPAVGEQKAEAMEKRSSAVRSILELLEQLPPDTQGTLLVALSGDLTSVYRLVQKMHPEMPELLKLENFLSKLSSSARLGSTSAKPPTAHAVETMDVDNSESTNTTVTAKELERADELQK